MSVEAATILGLIAAIVCTVLVLIFITPEKKRENLPKFFQIIHDLFNFKFLIIEKVLKVIYILLTLFAIAYGFFLLFSGYDSWWYGGFQSTAGQGLLLMIVGPIAIRLVYELIMMIVLLVKNVIEINRKLKGDPTEKTADSLFDAPVNPFAGNQNTGN